MVKKQDRRYSRIHRAKKKQEVNENKEKAVEIEIADQSTAANTIT
jgi:hypothetical protein